MSPRALGDLLRFSTTPLTAEQRLLLGRLFDEIDLGIATVARAEEDYPGVRRAAETRSWESVTERYARVLAEWSVS